MDRAASSAASTRAAPASGGWRVAHPCPQCGGEVELEETDRLLSCPYCKVRLYMQPEGQMHQFVLPARPGPGRLLFVPYWRIRGPVFTCVGAQITHGQVDSTMPAVDSPILPPSLGLRPQAMKLRFAAAQTEGEFLAFPPERPFPAAACALAAETPGGGFMRYQVLLTPAAGIVYLPVRIGAGDTLTDAVRGTVLAGTMEQTQALLASPRRPVPGMRFLPTLCPECGGEMSAARDSLVLFCPQCPVVWEAREGGCVRRPCFHIEVPWRPQTYLPFWRIRPQVTGCKVESLADLSRLANPSYPVQPSWEQEEWSLWVPGFKIHPSHFLRLAHAMTLRKLKCEEVLVEGAPEGDCHELSFPASCAAESGKLILADLMVPKLAWFPALPEIEVAAQEAQLVYVPFQAEGPELTQPGSALTVMRALLEYGRYL